MRSASMDNFEVAFQIAVPIGLVLVMFGMGLGLSPADFARIVRAPRAVIVGLAGQLVLLPLLAFGVGGLLTTEPALAIGLVIVASCPGGVSSNAIVFAARGDTALSVTLTATSSVITVFSIPLVVGFALDVFGHRTELPIELPVVQTMGSLLLLTILPISLGMYVKHLFTDWAGRVQELARVGSMVVLAVIVLGVIAIQFDEFLRNVRTAGFMALALNLLALATGYVLARWCRLGRAGRIAVPVEVGIQNGTLAVLVAMTLLGSRELAILPSVYAAVMLVTGGLCAYALSRQSDQDSIGASENSI